MEKTVSADNKGPPNIDRLIFSAHINVEKHFSKKNSKQIAYRFGAGRNTTAKGKRFTPFIRTNSRYVDQSNIFLLRLRGIARSFDITIPFGSPVRVMWHFQLDDFFTKKGQIRLRSWDIDNLISGPMDCLVQAGILKDDGLVVEMTAKKSSGPNSVSVEIYEAKDF